MPKAPIGRHVQTNASIQCQWQQWSCWRMLVSGIVQATAEVIDTLPLSIRPILQHTVTFSAPRKQIMRWQCWPAASFH